ncbi:MAG: UPF0182 family protein [Candidatus Mcinerneyibacterium aminivorans]|uniref:UPF0182 protein FXF47_02155 n=1 Tax=Candidatus Mcinerneyibacterium aminivorans TaxID=2703815 RepID=A0A5D0MJM5_9BACT|nr:MAG: UPF0182 family protein [Candidatus Mcinerneyibacterium aminivorans]
MFFILGVIFFLIGCIPLFVTLKNASGLSQQELTEKLKKPILIILLDIAILILINIFFHYYTEFLWFNNLNFKERFWTVLSSKIYLYIISALIAFLFLYFNLKYTLKKFKSNASGFISFLISLVLGLYFGYIVAGLWHKILLYFNQYQTEIVDPVFNKPINFYMFSLPLYSDILGKIAILLFFLLITMTVLLLFFTNKDEYNNFDMNNLKFNIWDIRKQLFYIIGLFFLILGINSYLNIFELLYSKTGVVTGAGFTDIHIRRYGYLLSFIIYAGVSAYFFISLFNKNFLNSIMELKDSLSSVKLKIKKTPIKVIAGSFIVLALLNGIVPNVVQNLVVEPNEISMELPYIKHNIDMTQKSFSIGKRTVTEKDYAVGKKITQDVIGRNKNTLNNVRLWDWRALLDNLKEQQEIRLYYEFNDVDIDRYTIDNKYKQVMIGLRELNKSKIAAKSQTWISEKFKYTHGYGAVMVPAHEFKSQGKPKFYIKNIPSEIEPESIQINYPQIYYGETTYDHVYVNTTQEEFDYPKGDENVYSRYAGSGGVDIGNWLNRFAYAWKYDGYKVILSSYFKQGSKIMYHRNIKERIKKVAPFLVLDKDPYPVITDDGRFKFIVDAYTISNRYPYSEIYRGSLSSFNGINYMRNSVKAVVDCYSGEVKLYITDKTDVIIQTYKEIFPNLFKTFEEMPEFLKKHIRYPNDYFNIQAELYSVYHMDDPQVFYQQEDVWEFATERYRSYFQKIVPYYVMVNFPEREQMEFINMLPFTPKNKNVMNAWMGARCDMPNYGELTVFTFPKGVEMLGPRQIEARIDQNSQMSQTLTLWGQRGSEIIRGNLLALPIFDEETLHIMYVEPIFLQAENANLPELKKVVVADQNEVFWANSFEESLGLLIEGADISAQPAAPLKQGEKEKFRSILQLINDANRHFEEFQNNRSQQNFIEAEESFNKLKETLNKLREQKEETAPDTVQSQK